MIGIAPHWVALGVLTTARTSLGFQFQSVASVSPSLINELGLSYTTLGMLIGLYFLPGVAVALPGAALGRRFGDKNTVVIGLMLMTAGGVIAASARDVQVLTVGRLVSGVGAVTLNVLMSKMVTDWFAGRRDIALAMAIFVNSFPIGIGFAMLVLSGLGAAYGWPSALWASSGVALAALLLVSLGYTRHSNDGGGQGASGHISRAEVALAGTAGAIWGLFNGCFAVMFGFAPVFLVAEGRSTEAVGLLLGAATWVTAGSIQVGGILAQRAVSPALLLGIGSLAWAAGLLVMAYGSGWSGGALIATSLLMGLPVGVIMSLPSQVLRPESRSIGMGIFYTGLYVGHGAIPPLAGWLQDRVQSTAAALVLCSLLVIMMPLLYAAFRAGAHQLRRAGGSEGR